ncbi:MULTISPECIES: isoprenylcysteine carboxyl methyltransferase family protein [Bacillus]|uniref:Isoprenylcysteine carboxyl methyltransferase n=2 Tax=Bacillus TaxID=1386 RepID=A0A0M5J9W8_9BACI|nr:MULTISPECIES: isoprenylcysteine carboxylmethyltransferase family protein [Bacillus]ALC81364.1 hypothetical protein AM592_06960 [Bacillus gobiensis]MBP1080385.1 methyltransferase [Bacillus capparidis]MED1094244.1 isoprenylcysteine carboxylmethyltransferase family protein [Bacillus capparidis]
MFWLMISILLLQRVSELFLANRNENTVKKLGAVEYGRKHYPFLVSMHGLFFLCFMLEVNLLERTLSGWWGILLPFICLVQLIRYWAIFSLGFYWNTKIFVIPDAELCSKGPYKWSRHPNYIVVALEFILLPLLYNAYVTAFMFTVLNACMMRIRIQEEEKALQLNRN